MHRLASSKSVRKNPLHGCVAAVSVGIYRGTPVLDLDYDEDSDAETDMNIVMNEAGRFIEIQGTAEGHPFSEDEMNQMLALAKQGINELCQRQKASLDG
jgi:ribonuclease PH